MGRDFDIQKNDNREESMQKADAFSIEKLIKKVEESSVGII